MAYDPADLRLPPWLVRLLNSVVRWRIPFGRSWSIGMTRPGVIFVAAVLAVWAAAFYSGNNLLYLCGAMMTAVVAAACVQAVRLLKAFPSLAGGLPVLQAGEVIVVYQVLGGMPDTGSEMPAMVDISWQLAGQSHALNARCGGGSITLSGRLQPRRRGLFSIERLQLNTSAPIGLFSLTRIRSESVELVVLPSPVPFCTTGASELSGQQALAYGDEWQELKPYAPGDSLARVHWRKADGDIRNWVVKRFGSLAGQHRDELLRVDLRLPAGMDEAAFEWLLGRTWFWVQQHRTGQLIFGRERFDLAGDGQYQQAIRAIAAAAPESAQPAGEGGVLLSLGTVR